MHPGPSAAPESCRVVAAKRACSADIQPNRPGQATETIWIVLVALTNNTSGVVDREELMGRGWRVHVLTGTGEASDAGSPQRQGVVGVTNRPPAALDGGGSPSFRHQGRLAPSHPNPVSVGRIPVPGLLTIMQGRGWKASHRWQTRVPL